MTIIKIELGNITLFDGDAIVNAANTELRPGTGVDGAIHKAAGPNLNYACRGFGGCKTGKAVITPGFKLPAKYVIHTATPVIEQENSEILLEQCYSSALELAQEHGIKTIAFPMLGAGSGGGFPPQMAASIAMKAVAKFVGEKPTVFESITFVAFKQRHKDNFESVIFDTK